jgi:histone-lysine N-methyltransferase SETD3
MSPLLWEEGELAELLSGSPVMQEALSRRAAIVQQWQDLDALAFSQNPALFPPSECPGRLCAANRRHNPGGRACAAAGAFGQQPFMAAFSVVLAHAVYLPSASCFALAPVASQLARTGMCAHLDLAWGAMAARLVSLGC